MSSEARFRDRELVFANGARGEHIDVASADPANYHAVISTPRAFSRRTIDGKLFRPPRAASVCPAVIVVPGSLGVAPSHLAHAEALTNEGIGALVIDPFGARAVTSTVANQTQYSFAASAYDVLAAFEPMRSSEPIAGSLRPMRRIPGAGTSSSIPRSRARACAR
jgi:dienelactone hydrolase